MRPWSKAVRAFFTRAGQNVGFLAKTMSGTETVMHFGEKALTHNSACWAKTGR